MFTVVISVKEKTPQMNSATPAALHKICGKEVIKWVVSAAKKTAAKRIIISAEDKELYSYLAENSDIEIFKPCEAAKELTSENQSGNVVVINAETPLITAKTIEGAVKLKEERGFAAAASVSGQAGRICVFADAALACAPERINEMTPFCEAANSAALCAIDKENAVIRTYTVSDEREMRLIENRIDLSEVSEIMQERINRFHMLNGVTLINPSSTFIGADVEIGRDTIIYPNTVLSGKTKIGSNCVIEMESKIEDSVLADNVSVTSSVILKSEIGEGTSVGPFAYVRPGSTVGKDVKVGDFVELKNVTVGDGTKISHLTYLGDSDIGKNVNFGCGTVTCNYDGKDKFRSVIGDGVFVGCNTNFVSPVNVGDGAYIAAGSTITEDIPQDTLAIARARQVNKDGWNGNKYSKKF
jgi:bifunctional UDP-N-acetylglucosamine pyrophosphorylase/glucosamine-1-phosphate N-acetyltransferase